MQRAHPTDASRPALPSGRAFYRRFYVESSAFSVLSAALFLALVLELLQLPPEQLAGLWKALGLTVLLLVPFIYTAQRRVVQPVVDCLDRLAAGEADRDDLRRGFAAVVSMPRRMLVFGYVTFQGCTASAALLMLLWYQDFEPYRALFLVVVGATGGTLSVLAQCYFLKLRFAPVRDGLATLLPDPAERASLVSRLPLTFKLHATLLSMGLVPLVFSVVMAYGRAQEPLGALLAAQQERALARVELALEDGRGLDAVEAVEDEAAAWAVPIRIIALDLVNGELAFGDENALTAAEWARIETDEARQGLGPAGSAHRYRHRDFDDGVLRLIAVSPRASFAEVQGMLGGFAVLGLICVVAAVLLARLAARDVGDSVEALRSEADRIAAGDLREGRPVESDDELGDLGRSFAVMARALSDTVGSLSEAADHIDTTAGDLAGVSSAVAAVARSQGEGMALANRAMGGVTRDVGSIATNAEELNRLMEESSSSILEMGATGDELRETTRAVAARVDAMAEAADSMVASVAQVGSSTETLASAASQTSESMEEMASAMLQVNASAEQTAALSDQVVDAAEEGRSRVRQAIEGMSSIAEATDAAERVVRGLDQRAREIGSILDVIDGVADETGLLALNAAIIAAQAGEQGRAFAVVAEQIKELANRVLESTKEIAAQIQAVQDESANAIGAIEEGGRNVSVGVDTSTEAGLALEQITELARQSGDRIGGIVRAVRAQTEAAGHVVDLMARVNGGVDEIRSSNADQTRGNEAVAATAAALRDASHHLERSTEEQSRGAQRLREHIEGVRSAAESIRDALGSQSSACTEASELIGGVAERTRENEDAAERVGRLDESLRSQASRLREGIERFRLS